MNKKKLVPITLICLTPLLAFSQNTFTNTGTNVGIGTTEPTERLEIATNGASNLQLTHNWDVLGTVGALKFNMAGTHEGGIEMERTIAAGRLSAMKFLVRSGSGTTAEAMRITQDNRIGIGTSSPVVKVSIYGPNDNDAAISLQSLTNSRFYIQQGGQYLKVGGLTPNGDGVINISNTGTVGVGTTSTGAHKLAVEGSIGARKIKVTQTGWADFVFDPGYKLASLHEVENYIKTNRHLPDVPSAMEVEKEGLDLGETDKRLLQKIEELTLYLIDQQKQLKAQQEQISVLQKQNEVLLKRLDDKRN